MDTYNTISRLYTECRGHQVQRAKVIATIDPKLILATGFTKKKTFPFTYSIAHAQTIAHYQREVKTGIFLSCTLENKIFHVAF